MCIPCYAKLALFKPVIIIPQYTRSFPFRRTVQSWAEGGVVCRRQPSLEGILGGWVAIVFAVKNLELANIAYQVSTYRLAEMSLNKIPLCSKTYRLALSEAEVVAGGYVMEVVRLSMGGWGGNMLASAIFSVHQGTQQKGKMGHVKRQLFARSCPVKKQPLAL